MDTLNDREVALILTVLNLAGKLPTPKDVQVEYRRQLAVVRHAEQDPEYGKL